MFIALLCLVLPFISFHWKEFMSKLYKKGATCRANISRWNLLRGRVRSVRHATHRTRGYSLYAYVLGGGICGLCCLYGCEQHHAGDFSPLVSATLAKHTVEQAAKSLRSGAKADDGKTLPAVPEVERTHSRQDCPTHGWIKNGDGHMTHCQQCRPRWDAADSPPIPMPKSKGYEQRGTSKPIGPTT